MTHSSLNDEGKGRLNKVGTEQPDRMPLFLHPKSKKYRHSLFFGTLIGLILVSTSIVEIRRNNDSGPYYFLLSMGLLIVLYCILNLITLLNTKVLFTAQEAISMRAGEIWFDQPACPFTLWIFCENPLSSYSGTIMIGRNGSEPSKITKLSSHRFWHGKHTPDYSPIKWRVHSQMQGAGRCQVHFKLFNQNKNESDDLKQVTLIIS